MGLNQIRLIYSGFSLNLVLYGQDSKSFLLFFIQARKLYTKKFIAFIMLHVSKCKK